MDSPESGGSQVLYGALRRRGAACARWLLRGRGGDAGALVPVDVDGGQLAQVDVVPFGRVAVVVDDLQVVVAAALALLEADRDALAVAQRVAAHDVVLPRLGADGADIDLVDLVAGV